MSSYILKSIIILSLRVDWWPVDLQMWYGFTHHFFLKTCDLKNIDLIYLFWQKKWVIWVLKRFLSNNKIPPALCLLPLASDVFDGLNKVWSLFQGSNSLYILYLFTHLTSTLDWTPKRMQKSLRGRGILSWVF